MIKPGFKPIIQLNSTSMCCSCMYGKRMKQFEYAKKSTDNSRTPTTQTHTVMPVNVHNVGIHVVDGDVDRSINPFTTNSFKITLQTPQIIPN